MLKENFGLEKKPLAGRTCIIWDYDGVKTDYKALGNPEEANRIFDRSNVRAALEVFKNWQDTYPDIIIPTEEQAQFITRRSYNQHGDNIRGFMDVLPTTLPPEARAAFQDALLTEQHREHLNYFFTHKEGYVASCPDTYDLLKATYEANIQHVVLTHGCAENWTRPIAEHQGYLPFYKEIIDRRRMGEFGKGDNGDAVSLALRAGEAADRQAVFVEDTLKHLQIAKRYHPEIYTVFIGDTSQPKPEGVDLVAERPHFFLQAFCYQNGITVLSCPSRDNILEI